ncbi:MAG: GNAT family N-acetyltransferase [Candidatus Peregrinibacteria bacterium]|nr:GNAT family N-acetyltransferase [Candidatus Peregrinibacteria bacterium]MCB9807873.1 GNAT family N-acetyltransferase [Candidatus Peribacteria bacterium]
MNDVLIEPLSTKTVDKVCSLAASLFDDEVQSPEIEIRRSLSKKSYVDTFTGYTVSNIDYWVAIHSASGTVGFIGLYENNTDSHEAVWIGWFGVHPDFRRKGIGSQLLDCVIERAKERNKKYLRVYTSTYFAEEQALHMYKKRGIQIKKTEQYEPEPSLDVHYLELLLTAKTSVQ